MGNRKPTILLGYSEIAGYYSNLFLGFRNLGYEVGYLNTQSFKYEYKGYESSNPPLLNRYIGLCRKFRVDNDPLAKVVLLLTTPLLVIWLAWKYDTFILGSGSSLLRQWDSKLLYWLGKKIIYVSLGSDTRPPFLSGIYKDDHPDGIFSAEASLARAIEMKDEVSFFESHCSYFINYPQHGHFNSRPFVNGMYLGFPTRIPEKLGASGDKIHQGPIRILHAPSRPKAKGTEVFRRIIDELNQEGYPAVLEEIMNRPNSEVIDAIHRSDLILDELYSDLPLGGLGSEAAMHGKAVLLGGYHGETILQEIPEKFIPPSIYVEPMHIKDALRELLDNPDKIRKSGLALYQFVKSVWSCEEVALRYTTLITDRVDSSWTFPPQKLKSLAGWGLSSSESASNLDELRKIGADFEALGLVIPIGEEEPVA